MQKVHVTIDGMEVDVAEGTTILEAAESAGIKIPRLCHDEGIAPSGNCRICVVEVEKAKALVGSCHTPVSSGMTVRTSTVRVQKARLATIELLLTGHTGTCVTDRDARECRLHGIASDLEVGPPRFRVRRPRLFVEEDGNPYVIRDMSKCILCRKCVRACTEKARMDVYSMAYRGFGSKVVVDCDAPLDKDVCKDCGICIEYCPTNALRWPGGAKRAATAAKALPESPGGGPQEDGSPALLDLLRARQGTDGCLSEASLGEIAASLGISPGAAFGVATFYAFLSTKPLGRHVIRVCKSLPCYLKNGRMILEALGRALAIGPGETTPDGRFSLELTNCIGACDRAPAILIDDTAYGDLTPDRIGDILGSYRGA
jgi:NADH:ubiquinone oxidoreductase subunit E/ferredoxin/Pyruvate/2-oxoacid:ferredoxin oxidoreductase delta subunit